MPLPTPFWAAPTPAHVNDTILLRIIIIIIITRPKPARPGGQDREARIKIKQIHFGVFSTSCFVPPALSSGWRGVTTDLGAGISKNVTNAGSQLTSRQV